ncbi:MAG TPA: type II toxin-antitoxin system MqsA family antitoxin [Terriglobales bacterium]|nr:type II toxin-antitoxin system MqsA family antitoxin [Terriglobales bacterium]
MTCVLCKNGETHPGTVTVTLERGKTVVVVRDVPADVCENCGEYYLDSSVAQEVYQRAEAAVARNAEVEILRYAA